MTMFEIMEMGIDAAIEKALDSSTTAPRALLTFDNDSMDSGLVPGTTAPSLRPHVARDDEARHRRRPARLLVPRRPELSRSTTRPTSRRAWTCVLVYC